jgi:anti-sigma-K factor RskA
MTAYTRDELFAIAAAHATGAASSEEELALHAAMQDDPELRLEVELNRRALDAMVSSQAVMPSDLVRGRLLAQARATAAPALQSVAPEPVKAIRPVRNTIFMAVCAASLAIMVGMGSEIVRLRNQVEGETAFVVSLRRQLDAREFTLNQMLHAENHLRVVHLMTTDTVTGPGIQVYWNKANGTAVLHAFRLPPAPGGRRYQLWAIGDGDPHPLASFNSADDGHALVSDMVIPVSLTGIRSLAVTVEPLAGSAKPSGTAVVHAEVRGT